MIRGVEDLAGPVEILVNNAGITRDTTFHKMDYQQWTEVVNTNLNACFNVTRPVIEGMRTRQWGRIVQISSINGQKGQYGQANYAAAKAGVHGFTISLAQENARFGITVNTVSPGYVGTDLVMAVPEDIRAKIVAQIPVGRLGRPEEIAHAVAFLTSEDSSWITGSNLAINGGHYMGWQERPSRGPVLRSTAVRGYPPCCGAHGTSPSPCRRRDARASPSQAADAP